MADSPRPELQRLDPQRPATARVFFALWPDERVRRHLVEVGQRLHAQLGGRLTREESIHMTLLFLGNVEEARLETLKCAASGEAFQRFSMSLETAMCWRHNRIAWIGPPVLPQPLSDGVESLRRSVAGAGFAFDDKPFAAHVTLLRNASCRPIEATFDPIEWMVSDFVLVRSRLGASGSSYEVIGRWPTIEVLTNG
ncbi:MAG TPA: RNA 2',3'-cyclic phosphodiesterase [Burkholderiales bacterium]|nr:RNA 2',3'-cyclic phosphodiesterase [Burkholderiales bacterium]